MRKYIVIGLIFILAGCSKAPNEIFKDKDIEKLFILYCDEVINSDMKDSNNVFIYTNGGSCNADSCSISFLNTKTIDENNEKYGKFSYKGLNIYVDSRISKNILELDSYNSQLPKTTEENFFPREFIEMWIHIKKDKIRYIKINFKESSPNKWEEIIKNY